MAENLREAALDYHRHPTPGKIAVAPTKPLATQRDLALAYSPGVAAACEAIVADPAEASTVTSRANLVAVITNGTAVLGLGSIGPLAAKPVMEGKGVLFKKFAGIDVFDIETGRDAIRTSWSTSSPRWSRPSAASIWKTSRRRNASISSEKLRERMKIPVFHDDQHGTAIIVGAAILNGLRGRRQEDRGRASWSRPAPAPRRSPAWTCWSIWACRSSNITVTDIVGVVYKGRNELMDPRKERFAQETDARTLGEVIAGADIFLGLSAPGVLKAAMVEKMAPNPLILALANPTPEIMPEEAKAVRPDAIMATGRSDYPNQVNNVLCFPFIFRGALDVGATTINEAMKIAAVRAIADLAMAEASDIVASAYGDQVSGFGPDYLIPKPFDPRLILQIAPAVAKAAMDSGVATRPIVDFAAYTDKLNEFVFRSGLVMRPVFIRAKQDPRRVVYAEGEEERVLARRSGRGRRPARQADPDRPPRCRDPPHREARPAHPPGRAMSIWSIPRTTTATTTTGLCTIA